MKPIKLTFWVFFAALTALWLLADTLLPEPLTYFSFRSVFVQYSGVIAIAAMSISMILATRPTFIEKPLNGLDKVYRLHKWLGITALVTATLHWWWAKGTKWMVGWGWLEKPARGPRPEETLTALEQFFRSQRGLAETIGEWTFYSAVILMVLALVKYFPYRLFRKTHKLLAVLYVALAYHSLILIEADYWVQPVGWVIAVLITAGVISAFLVLTNRVGRSRQVNGVIESVIHHPEMNAIEGEIKLNQGWQGHQPGQFAFVTSNLAEGPHPYTIASAWDPVSSSLTFVVKALGDWTQQVRETVKPGMVVKVEGPYGNFTFEDDCEQQIWIAAGIGVTPFLAKLQQLLEKPNHKQITLFYLTSDTDTEFLSRLQHSAAAAEVKLYVHNARESGRFNIERVYKDVPAWAQASIWFCGPSELGHQLRQDFIEGGVSDGDFHQELFQMR